jgi:hypothetical protein
LGSPTGATSTKGSDMDSRLPLDPLTVFLLLTAFAVLLKLVG